MKGTGLEHLPDSARVWIYQASKDLSEKEIAQIENRLKSFVSQWKAHGAELAAGFEVRDSRWVIIAVDEAAQVATGCSIDASVHEMQRLEKELGVAFFDRQLILWEENGTLKQDRMHDFWAKRKAGVVSDDTTVFNTLAKTVGELKANWKTSFANSWHAEMW